MKAVKVATLNVQGCKDKVKRLDIVKDAKTYGIDILAITETHVEEEEIEEFKGKNTYNIYHGGIKGKNKYTGVGIVVKKDLDITFNRITDRICVAEMNIHTSKKLVIIVAYAPTLTTSEKNPTKREEFYNTLTEITRKINKSRHILITLGDFNAKTGSGQKMFPEIIGKYGKGHLNSNGEHLISYAKEFNLYLTNTTFAHKLCHRTTWTAPQRINEHNYKGETRRQPYRNQIDYILTKNSHKLLVENSRSYGGTITKSDHKMVMANFHLTWWKLNTKKKNTDVKVNLDNFKIEGKIDVYKQNINAKMNDEIHNLEIDEKWEYISSICKKSAEEVLGIKQANHKNAYNDEKLKELSKMKKSLKLKEESTTRKDNKFAIRNNRKVVNKEIQERLKELEEKYFDKELKDIENYGGNQKAFEAVKSMKRKNPRKKLKVFNEKGDMINTEMQQVKIITNVFKETFEKPDQVQMTHYPPCENIPPFTQEEIQKASNKLKNGKSPGIDNVYPEMIKYAPEIVHNVIAEILNESVETENYLKVLRTGILTPLQKPPKKGMERKNNVRPIILLSMSRKVLAICVIERTWNKLKCKIPINQAAYQKGRSTTEQVFCLKIMAEKAITCQNYEIIIMMIDMSKAFDTVNRKRLMEQLEQLLSPNELRMMYLLINDVELTVRIGKEFGEYIKTNIGVAQGDCLSALLFIFYLANTIKPFPKETTREDHSHEILWSELDWLINRDIHNIEIDPQYADDLNFIRSSRSKINQVKRMLPEMLSEGNLIENHTKREEYKIPSNTEKWKQCKCLGSMLDTESDMKRRKGLALGAMKPLEKIFKNRHLSKETKTRIFDSYVSSIYLYNSELWVMTKTLEEKVDSFQRRLLRTVLNVTWPQIMKNEKVYEETNAERWSKTIKQRRLGWLGHLLRLNEDTPARVALKEALKETKKNVGRGKITWIDTIKKDIQKSNINVDTSNNRTFFMELEEICRDKQRWRIEIRNMISTTM